MRSLLAALFFAVAAAGPAAVYAAAPAASGDMDVQLWAGAQPGQAVVIVGVELPETVQLPATVRIPTVKGMSVDWAGEILDSAASQDPQREYVIKDGIGGQYAEFEISQSHTAQIELSGLPLTAGQNGISAAIDFVQTAPSEVTGFSVRLPSGAREATITPAPTGAPETNEAGEALYTLPSAELAAGAIQPVTLAYTTGSAAPAPQPTANSSALIALLLALLVVAAGLLIFVLKRQGSAPSPPDA